MDAMARGTTERNPLTEFADDEIPNVAALRARFGMSQERFADLFEVSATAVRNWEMGYPVRSGPARVLLRIAATNPEVLLESMTDGRARA